MFPCTYDNASSFQLLIFIPSWSATMFGPHSPFYFTAQKLLCANYHIFEGVHNICWLQTENHVGGIGVKYLNPSVETKKKKYLLKHIHVILHEQSWIHKKLAESCQFYSIYLSNTLNIFNLSYVLTCHWAREYEAAFVIFIQA